MSFPAKATPEFWDLYRPLPREVKLSARKAFRLWRATPFHPSLHFKKVGRGKWSARGVWSWIGSHADYDKLIKR